VPMTDSSHSMNPRGARLGVSFTHKETMQMSTTSHPRIKSQAVIDKRQVEIVDLKGTYVRTAGTKSDPKPRAGPAVSAPGSARPYRLLAVPFSWVLSRIDASWKL
jgi:hypothetical protein